MLAQLTIQDIVLIDRLDIEFGTGLSVLTGETGAGKSILLDALALALGGRGEGGLVRSGAERGQVTATFEIAEDHPVHAQLRTNEIEADAQLILRRIQGGDGRTRAFVNDQPCSAGLLKALGTALVEIHGQHADRALVDAASHRSLLDAFGGLEPDAEEVGVRYRDLQTTGRELRRLRESIEEAERESDYLRDAVAELEALAPEPGEEERLADKRQRLMQAEKAAEDISTAYETVGGGQSPIPDLAALLRRLERKAEQVPGLLDDAINALGSALDQLEECRAALESALRSAEHDPQDLESTEDRLFTLRGAARKYRVLVDELPEKAASLSAQLLDLDTGKERLAALQAQAAAAQKAFEEAASRLSERRSISARALEQAVNAELPALKLEAAEFIVSQSIDDNLVSETGFDSVTFFVRTNPGTEPGPLMKVASGGELSRFLLALKVALADKGSAPTLIFDEVDSGAGGAVAEAIGRRLARLAEKVQVISVTHAPQVAARAASHYQISKSPTNGGKTMSTNVSPIKGEDRNEEIARMLAGETISDEARAAAAQLLSPKPVDGTV